MNNKIPGRNNACDGKRAKFFEENKLALPNILVTLFLDRLNGKTRSKKQRPQGVFINDLKIQQWWLKCWACKNVDFPLLCSSSI